MPPVLDSTDASRRRGVNLLFAMPIYLDHNATSPLLPAVREAVVDALDRLTGNPSSPHAAGREAAMAVDRARRQVAALVDADPRSVAFTSGATEANAWALCGVDGVVLASAVEHPSVLAWAHETVPVDRRGVVDLEALDRRLWAGGVGIVSVMAANNETGVLQPTAEVARICRQHEVPYHCDATQIAGRLPVDVPADRLTLSAHKMGGPKGVGALVVRGAWPPPLLRGGPQERGRRAGTENVPAIVGFGVAAEQPIPDFRGLDRLEEVCRELGGRILGEGAPRLPNTVSVLFDEPGDLVVMALDLEGVQVSTGSACASGASEPSHVLGAMGLGDAVAVRFSLGPHSVVEPAIAALRRVLSRMRSTALEVGA